MSDDILQEEHLDQNMLLFKELPTRPVRGQIIKPEAKLVANKI